MQTNEMPQKYDFDTPYRRLQQHAEKWAVLEKHTESAQDPSVFPFSVADMDFKIAPSIQTALHESVDYGIFGYHQLSETYKDAFAGWMKRVHHCRIDRDWIVQTPGVVFSLYPIIDACTDPGDGVIIQTPVYQPFNSAIERLGREIVSNPLKLENNRFIMDLDDLAAKAANPKNRLLILCSPHNPVGRVWSQKELQDLARICLKYEVLIISDEIHHDLVYSPLRHYVLTDILPELKTQSIICTSPGKTFNLAGLNIANLIIPDQPLREKVSKAISRFGIGQANTLATAACQAAYTSSYPWYKSLLDYLEGNRGLIGRFMADYLPELPYFEPEGTYLAWIDLNPLQLDRQKQRVFLQEEARLFTSPGFWFGTEGIGYERLNFALPRQALQAGLERLYKAVRSSGLL